MQVLVSLQAFGDLLDETSEQLVGGVSHLDVVLDTEGKCLFDQIESRTHDLVGKQIGVLSK